MSAGWRAGRGAWSIVSEGSWTCSWTPSTKPISPRLDGMGPACGLTSCVRVVKEEDATAFVEAIIESEEGRKKMGKVGKVGKVSLIVVACTWQGLEGGRQHQIEGKEDEESKRNQPLVTIVGTYYWSCTTSDTRWKRLGFRSFSGSARYSNFRAQQTSVEEQSSRDRQRYKT